ncbi:MAG: hypothetical protein OEY74_04440 [Gammaproteobacteria bacterium]|nr:hypothetical protein [Gammaproteobacteria bacterium]
MHADEMFAHGLNEGVPIKTFLRCTGSLDHHNQGACGRLKTPYRCCAQHRHGNSGLTSSPGARPRRGLIRVDQSSMVALTLLFDEDLAK